MNKTLKISNREIREIALNVMNSFPEEFRKKFENISIFVEDTSLEDDEDGAEDDTLGIFRGRTLAQDEMLAQSDTVLPPNIVLYRQNLAEECDSINELKAEIRETILHEIGHYFGLDEDDLKKLGLD